MKTLKLSRNISNFVLIFDFIVECESPCSEEISPIDGPRVALVPIKTTSPERRITQKEIIAGEERPKYLSIKHHEPEGEFLILCRIYNN